MAKINSTFNAGYYIDKDVDLFAFKKEQDKQQKEKEKEKRDKLLRIAQLAGDDQAALDGVVIEGRRERQTFAIPFHMQCLHCKSRIPKGQHVYMNRYKVQNTNESKSSLGQTLFEIQFRCIKCSKHIYIRVDYDTPEQTGGYIPHKYCERFVGDFAELRKKEIERIKEEAIEKEKLKATMSEAERRGLENKARQEEDARLASLVQKRMSTTTEALLSSCLLSDNVDDDDKDDIASEDDRSDSECGSEIEVADLEDEEEDGGDANAGLERKRLRKDFCDADAKALSFVPKQFSSEQHCNTTVSEGSEDKAEPLNTERILNTAAAKVTCSAEVNEPSAFLAAITSSLGGFIQNATETKDDTSAHQSNLVLLEGSEGSTKEMRSIDASDSQLVKAKPKKGATKLKGLAFLNNYFES